MLSLHELGTAGHHGIWIDVFPIISIGGSLDYHFRRFCIRICNYSIMDTTYFHLSHDWIRAQTNGVMFQLVKLFTMLPPRIRRDVHDFFRRFVFMGHSRKTKRKGHVWASITYVHPASVFNGVAKKLKFEDDIFPCPPDYEEYLRNAYGDYMTPPPIDRRGGGHGDVIIDLENSWELYNSGDK